jgi:integrase/recombinase XerD
MQVEAAYKAFMSHGAAERLYAAETLKKHEDVYRSWLSPFFGQRGVEEITRRDVLLFRTEMLNRGIGIYRQYQIVMTLKLFLGFCRRVLHVECLNPGEITLPKRMPPKVEYLNNEEIERVRSECNTRTFPGLRLRALVEVLLSTGMRISEALSLDRESFDSDSRELEIVGKGRRRRTVFFNEAAMRWVRALLQTRQDTCAAVFTTTGYPPRRLARGDVSRFFRILKVRAGIKKHLTPHLLRHTYCTNLLNHGADITHIKELAGHSDIQTTARYYLGIDVDSLRKIVRNCLDYDVDPAASMGGVVPGEENAA